MILKTTQNHIDLVLSMLYTVTTPNTAVSRVLNEKGTMQVSLAYKNESLVAIRSTC